MRVIAQKMLVDFYRQDAHQDCVGPARAWYAMACAAQWTQPADVVAAMPKVSILKDGRAVFNLGGNKYRLVVWINYDYATIYTRFIGTHAQYDQIDANTI
ncbi:type II toxin-antitoxin system HigB family toxin [Variovorax sp. DAIF25]|jgi:mRNA interferase HigB|uniref:type II toxin-antitoxin system HigB family toxin n=1 Tax=Variovorax sp. DAIF25 TaxID=3080983 RepID=UPI003D6C096A